MYMVGSSHHLQAREVLRTQPERQFLQQVLRDFSHTKNLQQCMASLEVHALLPHLTYIVLVRAVDSGTS